MKYQLEFYMDKPITSFTIDTENKDVKTVIHNPTIHNYAFGDNLDYNILEKLFNRFSGEELTLEDRLKTKKYKNSLIPHLKMQSRKL